MALKTVKKYFDTCKRCGGTYGPEVTSGSTVTMNLNTAGNAHLPSTLTGIVQLVENGGTTDTVGRLYTIQYDNTSLLPHTAELTPCDVVSVVCVDCCVLLQNQIDVIRQGSKPYVTLAYKWSNARYAFSGVDLMAFAFPALPDATIVSYEFFREDGSPVVGPNQFNSYVRIPESEEALYEGGVYTVRVTDSAGRTNTAIAHVSFDDTLYELARIRRQEVEMEIRDHVIRETDTRNPSSPDIFFGGFRNPEFWGRDLNILGIGWSLTTPNQPAVRIAQHHLLVWELDSPVIGVSQYEFINANGAALTATCADFRSIDGGLYIVCFTDEIPQSEIPQVPLLPVDYRDWFTPVGVPGAVFGRERKMSRLLLTWFTDSQFNYTEQVTGPGQANLVNGENGNPVVIFYNGGPVLVGWRLDDNNKISLTWKDHIPEIEAAIADMQLCPPHLGADLTTARFWNPVDWFNIRNRPFMFTDKVRGIGVGINALAGQRGAAMANLGIGNDAAKAVTTGNKILCIGHNAQPQAGTDTNEIVIGMGPLTGNGSNTTTIGNGDTLKSYIRGSLVLGSLRPAPRGLLDLTGTLGSVWVNSNGTYIEHDLAGPLTFFANHADGEFRFYGGNNADPQHTFLLQKNGSVAIGALAAAGKLDIQGSAALWSFSLDGHTLATDSATAALGTSAALSVLTLYAIASVRLKVNGNDVVVAQANKDVLIQGAQGTVTFTAGGANQSKVAFGGTAGAILDALVTMKWQIGGTDLIVLTAGVATLTGNLTINDAAVRTLSTGAANGTKIGATGDKLAFFGANPIVRPGASTNTNTPTAGVSPNHVLVDTTFDGGVGGAAYTVGGLVARLKELGLIQ